MEEVGREAPERQSDVVVASFGLLIRSGTMRAVMARSAMASGTRALHCWLAFGLLPVLLALVPLAYASPPDPTWVAGFYDAEDFDEIVMAVVSASGVVPDVVPLSTEAADTAAGTVWPPPHVLAVAADSSGFTIRAPPSTAHIATQ